MKKWHKIEQNNATCPQEIVQIGRRRNNRGAWDLRLDSGAHPGSPTQLCWGLEWHRPVTTQDHQGRRGEHARNLFETLAEGEILKYEIYERHKALVNAADSWADAGTPTSSAREGLKSSYGVGIVNLILSINITCRYRNSKFLPSDDSCQHRTWERVQAARENESSGNAWENRTRWRGRWRQEPVSTRISGTLEAIDVMPSRIVFY